MSPRILGKEVKPMKRLFLLLIMLLSLLFAPAVLAESGCEQEGHRALCSAPGICEACGFTGDIAQLLHSWGTPETTDPTCAAEGALLYSCQECEETKTTLLPKLPHTEVTDEAVEPTCTETGLSQGSHCSICNEVILPQEVIPAWGHNEVTDEAVEPTCTETGLSQGSHCSICSEVILPQELIPAWGHNEVTDEAVEPTCTETGLSQGIHCSICSEVILPQEVIPARGHNEVTDEAVEPTCTETGLSQGSHCSICNEIILPQEVIPARGHNEVTDEAVEPTCTETGLSQGSHCSICNEIILPQELIPARGHNEVTDEAVEPTCTEKGLTEGSHCAICGEVITPQAELSRLYHNWQLTTSTPATCTESGSERYECNRCGYYYVERPDPLGHHFDEYLNQLDGTHMAICGICDQGSVENCQLNAGICMLCGYTVEVPEEILILYPIEASENSADLLLEITDKAKESLPEAAQKARHAFQLTLLKDGAETMPQRGLTVKLPLENTAPLEGLQLMLILEDGALMEIEYEIQDGMIVFITSQTGVFVFLPQ